MGQGTDKDTTKRGPGRSELAQAEAAVRTALEQLVQTHPEHGCFVVVADQVTGRFVQFALKDGAVLVDQPTISLQKKGFLRAMELLPEHYAHSHYTVLQKPGCSPEEGARLGMQILREVHMLPESAELQVFFESTRRAEPN